MTLVEVLDCYDAVDIGDDAVDHHLHVDLEAFIVIVIVIVE